MGPQTDHKWTIFWTRQWTFRGAAIGLWGESQMDFLRGCNGTFLDNCNWTFCLPKMAHPGVPRMAFVLEIVSYFAQPGSGDCTILGTHKWTFWETTIGFLGESQLDFWGNHNWTFWTIANGFLGAGNPRSGLQTGPRGPPRHPATTAWGHAPLRLGCAQAVPECFPEISSWHVVLRIRAQTIIRNSGTGLPGIAGCKYRPRQCSTRERQERTRNRATARRTLRQSVARHCQTRNDTSCTTAHTASHQLQKARQHTPSHQTSHATNYTTNYTKQEAGARPNPAGGRQCHQLQNRKILRRAPEESRRPPPIQENGLRTSRDGALPI
jgi:hypothetical protein